MMPASEQTALEATRRMKRAARAAVQNAIRARKLPRASALPCVDCTGPARDFDHPRGHDRAHALDVEPVCKPCHGRRSAARGEMARGARHGLRLHPERVYRGPRPTCRGERHPRARLDAPRVRGVRALAAVGSTQRELAVMYRVSQGAIKGVLSRRCWRHVG